MAPCVPKKKVSKVSAVSNTTMVVPRRSARAPRDVDGSPIAKRNHQRACKNKVVVTVAPHPSKPAPRKNLKKDNAKKNTNVSKNVKKAAAPKKKTSKPAVNVKKTPVKKATTKNSTKGQRVVKQKKKSTTRATDDDDDSAGSDDDFGVNFDQPKPAKHEGTLRIELDDDATASSESSRSYDSMRTARSRRSQKSRRATNASASRRNVKKTDTGRSRSSSFDPNEPSTSAKHQPKH